MDARSSVPSSIRLEQVNGPPSAHRSDYDARVILGSGTNLAKFSQGRSHQVEERLEALDVGHRLHVHVLVNEKVDILGQFRSEPASLVLDLEPEARLCLEQAAVFLTLQERSGLRLVLTVDPEIGVEIRVTASEIMSADGFSVPAPRGLPLDRESKAVRRDKWRSETGRRNACSGSGSGRLRGSERDLPV